MFTFDSFGIKLSAHDFWLDAHRKVDFSFISHGHTDHLRNHNTVLATPATLRFHALRGKQRQTIALDYYEPFVLGDLTLQLYPAGHVLGSAMIRVERNGQSLLYTGDFKIRSSLTTERIKIPKADILIMESTFGHPDYRNTPSLLELVNDLNSFIQSAHKARNIPVVLAYALGKGQEAMKILGDLGYQVSVHHSVWDTARVYCDFGYQFPNCHIWDESESTVSDVLILPPHLTRTPVYRSLNPKRTVLLSGWANSKTGFRWGSNAQIPLSDHADFDDCLAFVQTVQPKKIFTLHGFPEFADHLRTLGYNAEVLTNSG
jgi:putative mRNA 3-end processing factor